MNEVEKAFEAGFRAYREAFDHYEDSDESVEHSLKWRMEQYIAAQQSAQDGEGEEIDPVAQALQNLGDAIAPPRR